MAEVMPNAFVSYAPVAGDCTRCEREPAVVMLTCTGETPEQSFLVRFCQPCALHFVGRFSNVFCATAAARITVEWSK